jgi:ligand-binding SRPBCC domain-containing protein
VVTFEQVTIIAAPMDRCFDLARSVEVHLAGNVHFGEQAVALGGVGRGLIGMGEQVTWRARHLGIRQNLTSAITAMDRPVYFQDTMLRGAFRSMQHDHYFRGLASGETEMRDVFRFAAPVPVLGQIVEVLLLRRYMKALLHERNVVLKEIAESADWQRYLPVIADQGAR